MPYYYILSEKKETCNIFLIGSMMTLQANFKSHNSVWILRWIVFLLCVCVREFCTKRISSISLIPKFHIHLMHIGIRHTSRYLSSEYSSRYREWFAWCFECQCGPTFCQQHFLGCPMKRSSHDRSRSYFFFFERKKSNHIEITMQHNMNIICVLYHFVPFIVNENTLLNSSGKKDCLGIYTI